MKTAEAKKSGSHKASQESTLFFKKKKNGDFFSEPARSESTSPFFGYPIQAKLTIGQPNDKYEQEADATAERVVRKIQTSPEKGNPEISRLRTSSVPGTGIQPACTTCTEEEKLQRQEEENQVEDSEIRMKPIFESKSDPPEEGKVRRKSDAGATEATPNLEGRLNSTKGLGKSLDENTRVQMESGMGADFSGVRVHTGQEAVQMNKDLNSQAFTRGSDIYFNTGKYDTGSTTGKQLLAHELTHTVQQSNHKISRKPEDGASTSKLSGLKQLLHDLEQISIEDTNADKFCKPFKSKAIAQSWHRIMTTFFLPVIISGASSIHAGGLLEKLQPFLAMLEKVNDPRIKKLKSLIELLQTRVAARGFGAEVGSMWNQYLTGPRIQKRLIFNNPQSELVKGFINSKTTEETQIELYNRIVKRLPQKCRKKNKLRRLPPNTWKDFRLSDLIPRRALYSNSETGRISSMNFNVKEEIPGNIAGGIGSSRYGKDSRRIKGHVSFFRTTDVKGNTVSIKIRTSFEYIIRDAIDFCPLGTGDIGAKVEEKLTVPLSRLEASKMANDVPFKVEYEGKPIENELDSNIIKRCWPIYGKSLTKKFVQPKLSLSRPDDEYEREADETADNVVRKMKTKPEDRLVRGKSDGGVTIASPDLGRRLNSTKGQGRPLDENTRVQMESGMGVDFDNVRIHNDSSATQLNQELNSNAFTHGNDIYFNSGNYDTGSSGGKKLLAHELAHTVQQNGKISKRIQKQEAEKPFYEFVNSNIKPLQESYSDDDIAERNEIVKNLSPQKKSKLKTLLSEAAGQTLEITIQGQKKSKTKKQEKKFAKRVTQLCDQGIKNIRKYRRKNKKVAEGRKGELLKREQDLMNVKKMIKSPLYTFVFYKSYGSDYYKDLIELGNPKVVYEESGIKNVESSIFMLRLGISGGAELLFKRVAEDFYYRTAGFSRSALKVTTDSKDEDQDSGGGDSPVVPTDKHEEAADLDEEEINSMSEFFEKLEDKGTPGTKVKDTKKLAELIKNMTDKQKDDFAAIYNSIEVPENAEPEEEIVEKIEAFSNLTELEREVIKANIEKGKEENTKESEALSDEGKVRLNVTEQKSKENTKNFKELNGNLEDIWKGIKNSGNPKAKEFMPFDEKGFFSLQNELAIMNGLLEGAQEKSTEIKSVADGLRKEISQVQQSIMEEILYILSRMAVEGAVGAIVSFFTVGTGGAYMAYRIWVWTTKLNRIRKLINDAKSLIGIVDSVKSIIDNISTTKEKYSAFKKQYDEKLAQYRSLKKQVEKLESSEDLDDALQDARENLLESIQEQLDVDGQLAPILESLYIPPNTSEQELMNIMLNIPDGIEKLQEVRKIHKAGAGAKNPGEFPGILFVKSIAAGRKLYPFVGFLADKVKEEIGSFNKKAGFTAAKVQADIDRKITGTRRFRRRGHKQRKKETRQRFSLFRFKRFDYKIGKTYDEPKTIKGTLKLGFNWLQKEFAKVESKMSFKGFWTKMWFRYQIRKKLKELNKIRTKWKVYAKPKGKSKKNKNAKSKLVNIPKFRLKWLSKRPPFSVTLKLNPYYKRDKITGKTLTYSNFKDGIEYNTLDKKRTASLVGWLDDKGYNINEDAKGKKRIRHSGKGKTSGRGGKQFLQLNKNVVIQDRKLSTTKTIIPDYKGKVIKSDFDLPEGFIIGTYKGSEYVRNKRGLQQLLKKIKLGIDSDDKLVFGKRKHPIRKTKLEIITRPHFESIVDPEGMADTMFLSDGVTPNPDYKTFGRKQSWWRRHIQRDKKLQKRPKFIHVKLGNTKFARSLGDALGSKYLPQQKAEDDKGHIIAKRFDGNDSYNNLVPMDATLNRQNSEGTWYSHEANFARNFRRGRKNVEVKITLYYNNTRTRRPYRFSVKYRMLTFKAPKPKQKAKWVEGDWKNVNKKMTQ